MLPESEGVTYRNVYEASMLGFFASSVLPLRAGEFVRPWIFSRWSSVPVLTCFASVVVERVFDVLALMLILAICLSMLELPANLSIIVAGAKALSLIAIIISVVMFIAYCKASLIHSLIDSSCKLFLDRKFPELAKKIRTLAFEFLDGLKVLKTFSDFFKVVFSSLLLWSAMAFYYQIAIWAFDVDASYYLGFTVCSFIALAVAAPSAPGFLGTFQLGCLFALKDVFGYSQELAIAYSIIVHLSQYVLTLASGFYILKKRGLQLSKLGAEQTVSVHE